MEYYNLDDERALVSPISDEITYVSWQAYDLIVIDFQIRFKKHHVTDSDCLLRGGVQARKFRKHVPPIGPTLWLGLEVPDPLAPLWRPRPFSRQK